MSESRQGTGLLNPGFGNGECDSEMSPVVVEALETPAPRPLPWIDELRAPVPLSFREIGHGYRPGRSSLLSLLLHQLALLLIVVSSTHFAYVRAAEVVRPRVEPVRTDEAIYLLGGGSEGIGKQGGGEGSQQKPSEGVRARSRRGFAYPGPEPLVSDPPRATLGMQTILQPMLKHTPLLTQTVPLPLPNLVEPPPPAKPPEPAKPVLKVQSGRLAVRPVQKAVQAPKVTLSASASSSIPDLSAPEAIMPQAPPPKPVPNRPEASDLPVESRGQRGLLVLNAVPPPPDVSAPLPLGEVRSNFAVAPGEATVIADPAAGSKNGANALMTAGNGGAGDVASGDALADVAAGGGTGKPSVASGTGSGGRYGAGKGTGLNPVREATGTGRGMGAGAGAGSGAGTVLGSGKGSGSAPTTGGFPGISVSGGRYGNGSGASGNIRSIVTSGTQHSYSMTIASTASSGGGLADYGVFQDEKVYTNYIDMRDNDEDSAPSWILQYAVLQPAADPATPGSNRIVGTPSAPFPTLKQVPQLSPELAARCVHKLIVVSAIMTSEGKLGKLVVKQTPDAEINASLVEALSNWTFQPAEIESKAVPLKILLGIRLAAR